MITQAQFKELFPNCFFKNYDLNAFCNAINTLAEKYELNTKDRFNYFLAQCAHESMGFFKLEECLNYSAKGLLATWPSRFDAESAKKYAHKPMLIANRVYANRMGNGSEESGDGWRYKGAGPIQLTGKDSQLSFVKDTGIIVNLSLLSISNAIATNPIICAKSAFWFYSSIDGNLYADKQEFEWLTRAINGGLNGLDDRLAWLKKIEEELQ